MGDERPLQGRDREALLFHVADVGCSYPKEFDDAAEVEVALGCTPAENSKGRVASCEGRVGRRLKGCVVVGVLPGCWRHEVEIDAGACEVGEDRLVGRNDCGMTHDEQPTMGRCGHRSTLPGESSSEWSAVWENDGHGCCRRQR